MLTNGYLMQRIGIQKSDFGPFTSGRAKIRSDDSRRGLAPLELVLALFFLLLMMALVINFGTIASWRVRGNTAARFAVWRNVGLRTGAAYPNPPNWPLPKAKAAMLPGLPLNSALIDGLWNQPGLDAGALRGPAVVDPATGNQIAMGNQQYLEMKNQFITGSATLTKKMPLLPNLRPSYIKPLQPIVDPSWRFGDMFPQNAPQNSDPTVFWAMRAAGARLYLWYQFEARQLPNADVATAYAAYVAAAQAVQQNPSGPDLIPLDRDNELTASGQVPPFNAYQSTWPAGNAGGVNSNGSGCGPGCQLLIPQDVQTKLIFDIPGQPPGLITRIEGPLGNGKGGVPQKLAQAFVSMYTKQLQQAQQQQPPDQQLISQLQEKLQQLANWP
jgi:hypothetical protein